MTAQNNPTGRLYEILMDAHGKPSANRNKKKIREIWAEVFDLDPSDTHSLLVRISALIDLTQRAKDSVQKLQGVNQEIYLEPFENIENALSLINFNAAWENFDRHLTEGTLVALNFCADTSANQSPLEKVIAKKKLEELLAEVNALLESVLDSDLSPDLKRVIIFNLEGVRKAILDYRIYGIEGLRQVFEQNLGSMYVNKEQFTEVKEEPEVQKYFTIISRVGSLISIATGVKDLASGVIPLLTSGSP